jgi:hypothetical protein
MTFYEKGSNEHLGQNTEVNSQKSLAAINSANQAVDSHKKSDANVKDIEFE